MEMGPLLSRSSGHQSDPQADLRRRRPLNPNGHLTTNLLTGLRRRPRTDANKLAHEWVLEPLPTSADHFRIPDVLEHKGASRNADGSQSGYSEVGVKA